MVKNLVRFLTTLAVCLQLFIFESVYAGSQYTKTPVSQSRLFVIEDRGGESIKGYLPEQNDAEEGIKERAKRLRLTTLINSQFPVVTSNMRVGRVTESEAEGVKYQMVPRPIFIVGYDSVSMSWLDANKDMLEEKNAIGLVVNVANSKEMEALRHRAGGKVLLQPTQGNEIAEHMKITHYPFYMDNEGVMR